MVRTRQAKVSENPISDGSAPAPKRAMPLPKGWSKPSEALDRVTSVRTIFPDFNRAVRRGGLPVGRITTVHGPTHGGKTAFVLGLLKSFVDGGHIGALVDAEHATGYEFAQELLGELEQRDNFLAMRPHSYEETIDAVDSLLAHARSERALNADLKSICVVDSINKLVPKRELQQMLKALSDEPETAARGSGKRFKKEAGADQLAKGHWGRSRAALNQSWLDHLVPLLSAAGCALTLIAQEREEEPEWGTKPDVKIKGGAALTFDSSLLIRVSKAQPMYDGERKDENIIGFQHRVRIHKSKVGHMDGRHSDCVFHLSNGRYSPPGFDTARDALYVAKNLGVVQGGSWVVWRRRKWQGENRAVTALSKDPQALAELLDDVHATIDKAEGR